MPHNANLIQFGTTRSNEKWVSRIKGDPATFKAGLKVFVSSTDVLTLTKSTNFQAGISLGKNQSNDNLAVAVARRGEDVPVRLALKRASGVVTITSYANLVAVTPDTVSVAGTAFTAQSGAVTPGGATFQAATSNNATATSLAAQINAHATVGLKVYAVAVGAVVTVYSKVAGAGSTGTGNDIALAYADNGTATVGATITGVSGGKLSGGSDVATDIAYVVKGQKVYFNDATGEADIAMTGFSTISDATYIESIKESLEEDGTAGPAATFIAMTGGL